MITWIDDADSIDHVLRTIAIVLVDRLGGEVTITVEEWNAIAGRLGKNASLHVVGDGASMKAVVTTQEQIAQNPFMQPKPTN